jgi:predicted transcriptional regulator
MLSALCDSREVQVSVRLAAESLGCSSSTAHRYLQDLHSAGYITRELHSSIAEASIITLCRLTRWDKKTLPFFLSHPVSDELRLMWLLASPAFMTVGAVHGLSRALSGVLLDIPPEGISVNTLVSLRNRDADEVSRHLRMLRVEELISVQDGLVRIPAGTPEAAVAWWAQRHGRLRLSELRHISHDYERGAFRATNSIRQEAGLPELQDPAQRPRFR